MKQSLDQRRPHIVVLGTGFAAYTLVKKLNPSQYQVTVISPRNYFLFTPLLINSSVGAVKPQNITEPLRNLKSVSQYYQALCTAIRSETKSLDCRSTFDDTSFQISYDHLIIAIGAQSNTFGIEGVREHAYFLKETQDAQKIRMRILECLERACLPNTSTSEQDQLLHWVVAGGGPTGAEFAAELHDFTEAARKKYGKIIDRVKISLIEATDTILPSFEKELQTYAEKQFRREGVTLRKDAPAQKVTSDCITLGDDEQIPCGIVVWSTGIAPHLMLKSSGFSLTQKGFLETDPQCRVVGQTEIYALGDTAQCKEHAIPATAQAAEQQGKYLAKAFSRKAKGKSIPDFKFKSKGALAFLGGGTAVADFPAGHLKGKAAWIFWRSVYLTKIVGIKNKLNVLGNWINARLFGRDTSQFH